MIQSLIFAAVANSSQAPRAELPAVASCGAYSEQMDVDIRQTAGSLGRAMKRARLNVVTSYHDSGELTEICFVEFVWEDTWPNAGRRASRSESQPIDLCGAWTEDLNADIKLASKTLSKNMKGVRWKSLSEWNLDTSKGKYSDTCIIDVEF